MYINIHIIFMWKRGQKPACKIRVTQRSRYEISRIRFSWWEILCDPIDRVTESGSCACTDGSLTTGIVIREGEKICALSSIDILCLCSNGISWSRNWAESVCVVLWRVSDRFVLFSHHSHIACGKERCEAVLTHRHIHAREIRDQTKYSYRYLTNAYLSDHNFV